MEKDGMNGEEKWLISGPFPSFLPSIEQYQFAKIPKFLSMYMKIILNQFMTYSDPFIWGHIFWKSSSISRLYENVLCNSYQFLTDLSFSFQWCPCPNDLFSLKPYDSKWASLIAQLVKNPPAVHETLVRFLGWEDLLEKWQATHSNILGLPLWLSWYRIRLQCRRPGLGRSPGGGKGYPLQYSGLENSMDCIVYKVSKSRTWLINFHFHFHMTLKHASNWPYSCLNQKSQTYRESGVKSLSI